MFDQELASGIWRLVSCEKTEDKNAFIKTFTRHKGSQLL